MAALAILDAGGRPLRMQQDTAYSGASRFDAEMLSWRPALQSPDVELLPERDTMVARTRDLRRNNPLASGAVQSHIDTVVGSGLRLVAKPDWKALGLSVEWAEAWEREVQGRWRLYAEDPDFYCDAGRRLNFSGLLNQGYRSYMESSEILATLEWLPRRSDRYATCVNMVHPDRLSNPRDRADAWRLRGGVELDGFGGPLAYHLRNAHESDQRWIDAPAWGWKRVPTYTVRGRRQVIHIFDCEQPGQTRGKPAFVSVLSDMWMLKRWKKASVQAAIINAMYSATIKSSMADVRDALGESNNDDQLKAYMAAKQAWHKDKSVHFDGAKVLQLLPGEEFDLKSAQHPAAGFAEFESATLRHIAAGLNMSYEQLSRDYSKTNYSSARAAMLEAWRFFSGRRHHIASAFASQIYACWLEEALDRADVQIPRGAPDFYTAKTAWTRCQWIGAPRGHIDELKEIEARREKYELGITTLEALCAEEGEDWEEIQEQRARERARITALGMNPDSLYRKPAGVAPAKPARQENAERTSAMARHLSDLTRPGIEAMASIARGALDSSARLAEVLQQMPAPQISVQPHVEVSAAPAPEVHVNVQAPAVHVAAPPAPEVQISVQPADVHIQAAPPAKADAAEAAIYRELHARLAKDPR